MDEHGARVHYALSSIFVEVIKYKPEDFISIIKTGFFINP